MTKEEIIQIVCDVCEITPDELRIRSRREPLPTARALIAHFLYQEFRMSARQICHSIGHPAYDRTSVCYYLPSKRNGKKTLVDDRAPYIAELRNKQIEIKIRIDKSRK